MLFQVVSIEISNIAVCIVKKMNSQQLWFLHNDSKLWLSPSEVWYGYVDRFLIFDDGR